MKLQASKIIKDLRNHLGLSQEEFAEKIGKSPRHLSRIENDQADIHILELVDILQKHGNTGQEASVSTLAVSSNSYQHYANFVSVLQHRSNSDWDGYNTAMGKLEDEWKSGHPYLEAFKAHNLIRKHDKDPNRNTENEEAHNKKNVSDLLAAISISIKDFDVKNIKDYLLSTQEFHILVDLGNALMALGQYEEAIGICDGLLSNKVTLGKKNDDAFLPISLILSLKSRVLGKMGEHGEAAVATLNMLNDYLKKGESINIGPNLRDLAGFYHSMGEDKNICKLWALRAYSWVEFLGFENLINYMRDFLAEHYDTDVNYMP